LEGILERLDRVVEVEFGDLVTSTKMEQNKLRVYIIDESFVDVFNSFSLPDRWAFQWERQHLDNTMYRHDNIPHARWKSISSFPWHFHNGNEENVEWSNFGDDPVENLRNFFKFIRSKIM